MTPLPRKTITEYRILLPTSDVIAEVSLALSYPEPFRVTGLCLWIFGEYISQNRSHPQGPKSEFKEVTAAHRMSLLRFPWLFPIRNPCELRGLYRRSYFGPRTCGRSINHFHLSVRDSQSGFPHLIPIGGGVMRLSHFICQTLWNTRF